jgi:Fe2+ transport system protein FeoA
MSNMEPEIQARKALAELRRLKPRVQQIKLNTARASDSVRILSVHLDREGADALERLGVSPGHTVQVMENDHKGTVALKTRHGQVILGRQFTYQTTVSPILKAD